ncbi:Ulp1 protease family, carboxy-terminal domain protein [Medicago truncatula]|uniref:Ulp1 protease family, carboxy-terminal domain protein n=1 Tax=Medicago truncatula TaxID=3880 RepID=G7KP14_MEDTR|nr:Ulp1 protease family, carboxy-terminal domain protein [Medicago truncatula]
MVPFLDTYMKAIMIKGQTVPIYMDNIIYGKAYTDEVEIENIEELVQHNWLSATVVAVYVRFLYENLIKPRGLENKFSFLSRHIYQEDKQGQQIADILLTHKFKNKLIFAPVNLGLNHWVLLVINPGAEMIYYMDSLPAGHPNIDVYFGDYKCKIYSKDKLVEVEEDWATFVVEYLRDYIAQRLTL